MNMNSSPTRASSTKRLLTVVAAVCVLLLLAYFVFRMGKPPQEPAAQPGKLTKVVLAQTPIPHSALTILAKRKGYFEQEGLDVAVKEFTTGKLCFDAVLGGGADFCTVAEVPLMFAGFSGQQAVIVTTIASSPKSLKIVARKDKGVEKPADLKGKLVGTFKGGNAEYVLAQFLKKHGMTMNDVKATYMQPPELVAAITRGDLAAISMWEPNIYKAQKTIGDAAIVFTVEDLYTETFYIAVMRKFADEQGPTVEKFLRALTKAESFVKNNNAEAQQEVTTAISMDKETMDHIWPDFRLELGLDKSLVDLMTKEAQFAIESGARPAGTTIPDYRKMFEPKFLRELNLGRVDME